MAKKTLRDDIFMASAIGDLEWLQHSLKAISEPPGFDKNGFAPVHIAALHGRLEILKFFFEEQNVDINVPSAHGWRPIHLCISSQTGERSFKCLKYLLANEADPNVVNVDGTTPLHQAASEGHVKCLQALLDAGAGCFVVDIRGNMPLDLAILWGHRVCVRILNSLKWKRHKAAENKESVKLDKLRMQKLLWEIEQEDMSERQRQECRKVYEEWLRDNGILGEKNKQNKIKQKPAVEQGSSAEDATGAGPSRRFPGRHVEFARHELDKHVELQLTKNIRKEENMRMLQKKREAARFYNKSMWNFSTHCQEKQYLPNLSDIYPRDPFTNLPTKDAVVKEKQAEVSSMAKRHGEVKIKEKLTKPNLPETDIGTALLDQSRNRKGAVFRCQNIIDIGRLRRADDIDYKLREKACFHLHNNPDSLIVRCNKLSAF